MPNGKKPWEEDYTETPTDKVAVDEATTDEVAKPWEESYTGEEPVKKKEPTEPEEPTTGLDEFGLELPSISQPEQIISDRLQPQIDPEQEFARLQSNIKTEQERQAKIVKAQKGTELEAKKDQLIPMRDNVQFELDENEKEKRRLNAMLESFSLTTEDKEHVQVQLDKVEALDIALEDRLGELATASTKLSGELTELMGAAHYQKEQNFKAFTQDIPVFKMTTADVDDPLKDMDWFERHQSELVDQTTRQNRVMTEDLKVELATEQAIEIFKNNGIYRKTNPDYLENRKKFLDSLDKQGVSGYKLYRALGMDYVPTTQESLDNDYKKMEAQIKGSIPKLQLLTISVYEDVFGEEKARELYENEGRNLDEVRRSSLAKQEELAKVGELPTIGIMDDIKGEGGLAVAGHVVAGLFNVISAVAPSLITGVGTLGATAVTDQMGGALYTFNKAKADHLGISIQQLYDNGLNEHELAYQVGGFAATLEAFGMKGTMNAMTKSLTKKGGYQIAASMFLESGKEGITEVAQLGLETYLTATAEGKNEQEASELAWDKMLSEEGLKTLVTGALGSGIMGAGGAAFNEKSTKLNKRKAELEVEKAKAKKEGRDGDIELYIASIEKVDSEIETLANDQADNIVKKSENETTVDVAKAEITRLEGEMNKEGITPAGKEALQTEVDAIKQTIKPIEDAIQEPSPEKVPVQPEAERGKEVRREDAEGKEVTEEVKEEKIEERVVTEPEPEVKVEKFDGKDFSKGKKSEDIAKEEGLKFATPEEAEQHISEKSENPLEIAESYERSVKTAPEAEQKGYKTQVIEDANIKITPEEFAQYSDPKLASKRTDAKFIDSKRVTPLDAKLAEISEDAGVEISPDDFAAHIQDFEMKAEAPKEVGVLGKLKERFKEITGKLLTPKLAKQITTAAVKKDVVEKQVKAISKEFEEQKAGEKAAAEAKGKPKEAEPQPLAEFSGIKKSLVSPEVQAKVDWNKVSDKDMMDMGKTLVDNKQIKPERIVTEITEETPRALQPQEVAGMIYYKTKLDTEFREAIADQAKLKKEGKSTKSVDKEIADINDKIAAYELMSLITAQQQSLAFRLRQYLRDSVTFDVVKAISQYKFANEGKIPKEVQKRFEEIGEKNKELVGRINELEAQRELEIEQGALQNIIDDVDKKPKPKKKKATAKEIAKKLAKKIREGKLNRPGMFMAASPASLAWDGAIEAAAKVIEGGGILIDAIAAAKQKMIESGWYKKLNQKLKNKALGHIDQYAEENLDYTKLEVTVKDDVVKIPPKLIRAHVANGVREMDGLTDIIHEEAVIDNPDITKRQVRDAITGYGKTVNLSKDEVSTALRKLKRIGKLQSAIEDAKKGKRPFKKLLKRDEVSDEQKGLQAQLDVLLAELPQTEQEVISENEQKAKTAMAAAQRSFDKINEQINQVMARREAKPAKEKLKPTPELEALRKKRDEQRKVLNRWKEIRGIAEADRLKRNKARVKKEIAKLQTLIANKDFAKKKPKETKVDKELETLRIERENLMDEVRSEQFRIEQENRSGWEKAADFFADLFGMVPRALIASWDLSAAGVQGLWYIARDPANSAKAFVKSVRSLVSPEFHKESLSKIKAQPWYPALKQSGVAIIEEGYEVTVREEQALGNIVNILWNSPAWLIEKTIGNVFKENALNPSKKVAKVWRDINPYKASERAYTAYLNHIRIATFLKFSDGLKSQGITIENEPEIYKAAAKFVNAATGRGSLEALGLESSNKLLSMLLFSARRTAATLQLFANPVYWVKMPKEVRKMAMRDMIQAIGTLGAFTLLAQFLVGDDEDDDDFLDPNSTNFMKVKIKGEDGSFSTVSFLGPLQSLVTTVSRLSTGKFRSATTGEIEYLGERSPTASVATRWDVAANYFWNKKSPGISAIEKILDQQKGREMPISKLMIETMTPIWMHDMKEVVEDHPPLARTLLTGLNMIGLSTQHFKLTKRQQKKKRRAEKASARNKKRHDRYLKKLKIKDKGK